MEGRGREEWEMIEQTGQGASGTVFKGAWKGEDVAIKLFMDPEYSDGTLRKFEKEIGIMQHL